MFWAVVRAPAPLLGAVPREGRSSFRLERSPHERAAGATAPYVARGEGALPIVRPKCPIGIARPTSLGELAS